MRNNKTISLLRENQAVYGVNKGTINIPMEVFETADTKGDIEDWLSAHNPDFIKRMRKARADDLAGRFIPLGKIKKKVLSKETLDRQITAVIEKDKDGYFAFCPQLQGCYTQGDNYEETVRNLKDVIRLHIEDRLENGEKIDFAEEVNLINLKI